MSAILDFFVNNYILFLIISLILIFALIGYFVDTSKTKEEFVMGMNLDEESTAKLAAASASNMTLNQMVKNPTTISNQPVQNTAVKVSEVNQPAINDAVQNSSN